jgi:nucleoid DNA-binding protein
MTLIWGGSMVGGGGYLRSPVSIVSSLALRRAKPGWGARATWRIVLATNKKSGKSNGQSVRPVKEALTKSALISRIAEENELTRSTAAGVFATLESVLLGSVHPKGIGEFTLPGLLKVTLRKVPARKAGTMIRNPSTGEMVPGAAKPASVRVKVRALSKLKAAATS